jgi:hypothetical protein
MPKLFVKCIPENEDDKQTIIIYDDLGDHIGKYGKFDIKVNQRQLRLGSQYFTCFGKIKLMNNYIRKNEIKPDTEAQKLSTLAFHPIRLCAENR